MGGEHVSGPDPRNQRPRLLDIVRERIRMRHYSPRTERAYVGWIRRFILFHHKRHPREMGEPEVVAFLSGLATQRDVSASTQNQALSALVFLYGEVLGLELDWLNGLVRARRPQRLPVVLNREEVQALLAQLHGTVWLMALLMYGAGLRLFECAELRVKDIAVEGREIRIRDGKG
jgi:integrase